MDEKRNSDRREASQEFCALVAFGCSGKSETNEEKTRGFSSAKLPPLTLSVMRMDMMKAGSSTNISFDQNVSLSN